MDKETDVKGDSSTSTEEKPEGAAPEGGEKEPEGESKENNTKDNLANLRQLKEKAERERDEALAKLNERDSQDFSLDSKAEEKEEQPAGESAIFKRDMKEATRLWTRANKPTSEQWAQIKSKVTLNGDETQSEIEDKIQEAFDGLPDVRQKREEQIRQEERKKLMGDFNDNELDVGTGGDFDPGSGDQPVRLSAKDKAFAKNVGGLTDEEIAKIDLDGDPSRDEDGQHKMPIRQPFQP